MKQIEGTWQSKEGITIYHREWTPDIGTVTGAIVLVHGLGEHSGRYTHVAEYFTGKGFAMLAFDLPGHGKSSGKRGHASYEQIAGIIRHFVDATAAAYPEIPLFLYGHSLGGALALYYGFHENSQETAAKLKGMVITSPGLGTFQPVSSGKLFLAKVMAKIAPSFTMSNDLDQNNLSRVKAVVDKYRADPLVHDQISAKLGLDLIQIGEWMQNQKTFPVPLLLLAGTNDHIVNRDAIKKLANNLNEQATFQLFDEFCHELHNEIDPSSVMDCLHFWMQEQMHTEPVN